MKRQLSDSQRRADELAALRRERDELREALDDILNEFGNETRWSSGEIRHGAKETIAKARALLTRKGETKP